MFIVFFIALPEAEIVFSYPHYLRCVKHPQQPQPSQFIVFCQQMTHSSVQRLCVPSLSCWASAVRS